MKVAERNSSAMSASEVKAAANGVFEAAFALRYHEIFMEDDGYPIKDEIREELKWVAPYFEEAAGLDPSSFGSFIEDVAGIGDRLCNGTAVADARAGVKEKRDIRLSPTDFSSADLAGSEFSNHWNGTAADGFKAGFLNRLGPATANQATILLILENAMRRKKEAHEMARRDILKIAHNTKAALEKKNQMCSCLSDASLSTKLSIGSGVLCVGAGIATFLTGGTAPVAAVAYLTIASGISGVGSAAATIEGSDCESILQSAVDSVKSVYKSLSEVEQDLIERSLGPAYSALCERPLEFAVPGPSDAAKIDEQINAPGAGTVYADTRLTYDGLNAFYNKVPNKHWTSSSDLERDEEGEFNDL